MKVTQYIKELFAAPSAELLALRELETAKKALLEAHTGREYAASMVAYHESRIRRLSQYLSQEMQKGGNS
jgi:hypothetical protein